MKKTILIVEDEFLVAMNLKRELEKRDFHVCDIAAEGKSAVESAKKHNPDAILMDINLVGEMDGIETAQKIRSFSRARIVFISGYRDQVLEEKAMPLEPAAYLLKPVNANEIADVLSMVCI